MNNRDAFIDGAWVSLGQRERCRVLNPSTGHEIASVGIATVEDVDRAVSAAARALKSEEWSALEPLKRGELIHLLADEIENFASNFADTIVKEAGIPAIFAADLHVHLPLQFPRYYSALTRSFPFETSRPSEPDARALKSLGPIGVAALIVPWNIPLTGILAKVSPALAAGCTVIIKPSPETPLTAIKFAQAAERVGFPPGVINVILTGVEGTKRLCGHPQVRMISFTGSTAVGREIATTCAQTFKRSALELGGNAAAIVLEDAPIDQFAEALALQSLVMNNGEACVMQRRILVPRSSMSAWSEALAGVVDQLPIGDAVDPTTMIGPMISKAHQERITRYTEGALASGAKLATKHRDLPEGDGFFVSPAVFTDVSPDIPIACEEVFGPVACLIPYDNEGSAVEMANATDYGLSGSVWSADADRAEAFARRIEAGTVWINGTLRLDPAVPFGGIGHSGWGRELGEEGLMEFCEIKSVFRPVEVSPR